jgi:hypothetical protein
LLLANGVQAQESALDPTGQFVDLTEEQLLRDRLSDRKGTCWSQPFDAQSANLAPLSGKT